MRFAWRMMGPLRSLKRNAFRPDVILIDIGLPGMDGLELARSFRMLPDFAHTPLVAVTGYANESDRQRAHDAGFNHHLCKPADLQSVQDLLATFKR